MSSDKYISSGAPPLKQNDSASASSVVHPQAPPLKQSAARYVPPQARAGYVPPPQQHIPLQPPQHIPLQPPPHNQHTRQSSHPHDRSPSKGQHNSTQYNYTPPKNHNQDNFHTPKHNNQNSRDPRTPTRSPGGKEAYRDTVPLETTYNASVVYPPMRSHMENVKLGASASGRTWGNQKGVVELEGDLLESDCDVIIHCCNCLHTMGAGIALTIKERWYEAYQADSKTPKADPQKMSHFSWAYTSDDFTIVNLYAQFDYGRGTRRLVYDALRCGLQRLVNQFDDRRVQPKVGTYWLGCSNAGGDPSVVRGIFNEVFVHYPIFVYDNNNAPWKKNTPQKAHDVSDVAQKLSSTHINTPKTETNNVHKFAEPISESTSEPTPEPTPKQIPEPISLPTSEPTSESTSEPTCEFPLAPLRRSTSDRWADDSDDEDVVVSQPIPEKAIPSLNPNGNAPTPANGEKKKRKNQHRTKKRSTLASSTDSVSSTSSQPSPRGHKPPSSPSPKSTQTPPHPFGHKPPSSPSPKSTQVPPQPFQPLQPPTFHPTPSFPPQPLPDQWVHLPQRQPQPSRRHQQNSQHTQPVQTQAPQPTQGWRQTQAPQQTQQPQVPQQTQPTHAAQRTQPTQGWRQMQQPQAPQQTQPTQGWRQTQQTQPPLPAQPPQPAQQQQPQQRAPKRHGKKKDPKQVSISLVTEDNT